MRYGFFFLLACCYLQYVEAQSRNQQLTLKSYEYDFGFVHESDSVVFHDFLFIKKGNKSSTISGVHAECGCLNLSYEEKELKNNDTALVRVLVNLAMPVQKEFHKSFTVFADNDTVQLVVKGHVIPSAMSSKEAMFTQKLGPLKVRNRNFQFGLMGPEDTLVKYFEIYNPSSQAVSFGLDGLPSYVEIEDTAFVVQSKEVVDLVMTYQNGRSSAVGYLLDTFYITTMSDSLIKHVLYLSANSKPKFSSDSLKPKVEVEVKEVNLGEIITGSSKDVAFELINLGPGVLKVLKVVSPCTCITVQDLTNVEVKSGGSLKVAASVSNDGRKGYALKKFYVYTNDLKYPIIEFRLKVTFVR